MENYIIRLIIPFSLVLDILTDTVFDAGASIAVFKAIVIYTVIGYSLLKESRKRDNISLILIIFFLYVISQIPYSRFPQESIRMSLKVFASIFMFSVGFNLISSIEKIKYFGHSILITIVLYIGNFIVSQAFGLGESVYTGSKEFVAGNLQDNWNIITYLLLLIPLVRFSWQNNMVISILALFLIILLVVSLKRIAIISLIIGYGIYFLRQGKAIQALRSGLSVIIVLVIALPFYKDVLTKRILARGDKLDTHTVKVVQEETRYAETIDVWTEALSFKNFKKSIVGGEAFYSNGNYGRGRYGDRQIHVDYNLILNTIGIFGLFLYFQFHRRIFKYKRRMQKSNVSFKLPKSLDSVFWALFYSQFITSFGGQMYATTFRMMIYLYLGAYIGYYYHNRIVLEVNVYDK